MIEIDVGHLPWVPHQHGDLDDGGTVEWVHPCQAWCMRMGIKYRDSHPVALHRNHDDFDVVHTMKATKHVMSFFNERDVMDFWSQWGKRK